jgi:hypothetical protein
MLNRYLSLLVSAVALASAAAMLIAGARPVGAVTLAERAPCIGLAILALALAVIHLRVAHARLACAEAAMWSGLSIFLFVAAFASPQLGLLGIVAALTLAGTSVARLVDSHGRPAVLARLANEPN